MSYPYELIRWLSGNLKKYPHSLMEIEPVTSYSGVTTFSPLPPPTRGPFLSIT